MLCLQATAITSRLEQHYSLPQQYIAYVLKWASATSGARSLAKYDFVGLRSGAGLDVASLEALYRSLAPEATPAELKYLAAASFGGTERTILQQVTPASIASFKTADRCFNRAGTSGACTTGTA
jgi:hypothetical protein